jgi:hypothetical protein
MSYILDALKKSDQERQRNSTPGIHTVHATLEREPGRRKLWPYVLILALAFNAGLLLWWLHPWQSEKSNPGAIETHQNRHATTTRQSAQQHIVARHTPTAENLAGPEPGHRKLKEAKRKSSLPAETLQGKPVAEHAGPQLRLASKSSKLEKPGSTSNKVPVQIETEAERKPDLRPTRARQLPRDKSAAADTMSRRRPRVAEANRDSALKAKSTPAPSPAELPSERAQAARTAAHADESPEPKHKAQPVEPQGKLAMGNTLPQEIPSSARAPAAVGPELQSLLDSDSKSEESVPQLHDLPFAIRQELPRLSLSMLVYAKNPADRMVGINGQVLREGQDVGTDLKLERITPNGAIFTFHGHRFYKGVH